MESDRGSVFLLCALSGTDPRFRKYPRLPVLACDGYAKKLDTPASGGAVEVPAPRSLPGHASGAYDAAFMTSKAARNPNVREKTQLMSASEIERTLVRLAYEIIEKSNGGADLGLVGIRRRGVPLAERLAKTIGRIEKKPVPVGSLDITLYRDDLSTLGPKPVVQKTDIGIPITGKTIILVDDVLYTGRTVRAALDALFRHGRPRLVQLCALIDRGHRELPVEATYVGRKVQTSTNEIIEVRLREVDDAEQVMLMEKED
jgi:pyrimidine operon attenuation protein / uracil phosphoribosyltransferase